MVVYLATVKGFVCVGWLSFGIDWWWEKNFVVVESLKTLSWSSAQSLLDHINCNRVCFSIFYGENTLWYDREKWIHYKIIKKKIKNRFSDTLLLVCQSLM